MTATASNRFQTYIAISIAVATVLGAILAARATILNDTANQADQSGLASAIDLALTRASDEAGRTQNLIAFLDFSQHRRLADLIVTDIEQLDSSNPAIEQLLDQAETEWNKAIASRSFFDTDYYDKDSQAFDQQRFLDAHFAEVASKKDLEPEPHFNDAEATRAKAVKFVLMIAVLSFALFCFAVAGLFSSRWRYAAAGLGTIILIGTIALAIIIETAA
ncbi:MAG TPA: hypothetical protein VFF70_02800 [Anaerolineae bacterium]|jgi:hypothetical protein|nr:hypothetical protein [Anaerolineae bacterium]